MLIRLVIGVQKTSHQSVPGGVCSVKNTSAAMLENGHFAHSMAKFWRVVRKLDSVAANTAQLVLCTFWKCPQNNGQTSSLFIQESVTRCYKFASALKRWIFAVGGLPTLPLSVIPTKCIVMSSN